MTTKDTIQGYFSSLQQKRGWESFLAEDMVFTIFASPNKQVRGRAAYLEATKRFYRWRRLIGVGGTAQRRD